MKPKPRVNNVDNAISEAMTISTSATAGEQANQIKKIFRKHSFYYTN